MMMLHDKNDIVRGKKHQKTLPPLPNWSGMDNATATKLELKGYEIRVCTSGCHGAAACKINEDSPPPPAYARLQ